MLMENRTARLTLLIDPQKKGYPIFVIETGS